MENAIACEPTAYSPVARRLYTVQVDPEPMSAGTSSPKLVFRPLVQHPSVNGISKGMHACNSEYASSEGQGDAATYQAR